MKKYLTFLNISSNISSMMKKEFPTHLMQYNRVGKTHIYLSAVGLGTCQLRLVPESQAIETLIRSFELGVNWVHTAPDYEGAEDLIAKAIDESGRNVMVLSQGYGNIEHFEYLFENTCRIFKKQRLEMFGIACIDDREYLGENVWSGGMVDFLLKKKQEGRLGGIFCTTHGTPEYISRLITSGCFDAVMLAYNPLGFHLLSYFSKDKDFENIELTRKKIFPLAMEYGVSLLIMKPLAGGLLCRSKAFPPYHWFSTESIKLTSTKILRAILRNPAVCAVAPGTASVEEAEENARAGHRPHDISEECLMEINAGVKEMKSWLCSRCGHCEPLCSKSLPISWLFRDAYICSYPSETFETADRRQYFHLHPDDTAACLTCTDATCFCPNGIDIPASLIMVHERMLMLRKKGLLPATPEQLDRNVIKGAFPVKIIRSQVPQVLKAGHRGVCRFWLHNLGARKWRASPGQKIGKMDGLAVYIQDRLVQQVPLRHDVKPGSRTHFAFEIEAPPKKGHYRLRVFLTPLFEKKPSKDVTLILSAILPVEEEKTYPLPYRLAARFLGGKRRFLNNIANIFRKNRELKIGNEMDSIYQKKIPSGPIPRFSDMKKTPRYGVRYLDHNIPEQLPAGTVYGARVTIKNTGGMTWQRHHPKGNRVDLVLVVGDEAPVTCKMPRSEVRPGEQTTICFPLRIPFQEGHYTIRLELVEQKVAWFSHRGVEPLILDILVELTQKNANSQVAEAAFKINPWHYQPTHGVSRSADGRPFPLFVSRAQGCRIWDQEEREYIDYIMGWGSELLGYADHRIQKALEEVLYTAAMAPFPHPVEMEVARMLTEDIPCAEMVIFGKNGSDACTAAARLARVFTGKRMILYSGYHGWQDFWAEQHGFARTGIPDRPEHLIHRVRFNDLDDFFRLYSQHKGDLAAVMIEPSGPGESVQGPEQDADQTYLETIAVATRKAGALLIFDEIITCYRYPGGSVQKATGVIPDLTCLGKALASGMPLSAMVGRAHIFQKGMKNIHYGPTFKGEIYSLAAAKAAINIYREEPVAEHVWNYGLKLKQSINAICQQIRINAQCKGPPFRMALIFNEPDPDRLYVKRTLYLQELLKAGVTTYNGIMLPSYAHDDDDLECTLTAVGGALEAVAEAEQKNDFHMERCLEIPLL